MTTPPPPAPRPSAGPDLGTEALRLLHDLTPGGSEYFDNPRRCYEWVQNTLTANLRITVEKSAEANRLRTELQAEREAAARLVTENARLQEIAQAWSDFEDGLIEAGVASIHADMESWGRGAFFGNGAEKCVTVVFGGVGANGAFPEAVKRARAALTEAGQ